MVSSDNIHYLEFSTNIPTVTIEHEAASDVRVEANEDGEGEHDQLLLR
jgi:hypothetical protein